MYHPIGFDRKRAIQLAELVLQAYHQLEAFNKNKQWELLGGYSLIVELQYLGVTSVSTKSISNQFDSEFRSFAKSISQKAKGLPIGFIASKNTDVYLVFRGTMTITEWIRDFSMRLTPYPYGPFGKVHDGFIQTYNIFRKSILDGLKSVGPRKNLFIAGHSLGAALATLSVPDISASTPFKIPTVYTYASPRVGDKIFAIEYNNSFRNKSFRIVNTCDLVTSIPFPVPFLKFIGGYFTHVETPIDFTSQE
jgi:predicted lipase